MDDDLLSQLVPNSSAPTVRHLFDGMGVASLLMDESGFLDCNQAALALFKIPTPLAILHQPLDFLSPVYQSENLKSEPLLKQYVLTALDHNVIEFEWKYLRLDGTEFPAQVVFYAITLDSKPIIQATVIDNTQLKQTQKLLKSAEDKYRLLFNAINASTLLIDDTLILNSNDQAAKMLDCECKENLINQAVELIFPESQPSGSLSLPLFSDHCQLALKLGENKFEFHFQRFDGRIFPAEVNLVPIKWDGKHVISLQFEDITYRKDAEQERRIAAIAFDLHEGVLVTDDKLQITRINQSFTDLLGYTEEELLGQQPSYVASGRHDKEFYKAMWADINQNGFWQGQICNRRKSGDLCTEWLTISTVETPEGVISHYIGIYSDIARHGQASSAVYQLAYYDALTNLPNRRLLFDRIEQAMIACKRNYLHGAIIYMDLDNFKLLNDTRGHDVGDELLVEFAKRLQLSIREGDTIARMGGDEFVILLENLSEDLCLADLQVQSIAEKLLESIAVPFMISGLTFNCTSSFGVRLFNQLEHSVEELLKQADVAMYEAKRSGGNSACFFKPQMQASLDKRAQMQSDLHEAIKCLQLSLNYQIQVDHKNGVEGVEVFLRWVHPSQGLIPPNEFILLAEESDVTFHLGYWVLEAVCQQLQKWQRDPQLAKLIVAINVSVRQFRQPSFVSQIKQLVAEYDVDPQLIKLELTEELLLADIKDLVDTMTELKSMGIHLTIDDFGSGYSSLVNLKLLPLNQLKIDRSLIQNITHDAKDAAIVKSIVDMARNLDLNVIAEGVETQEQAYLLEKIGCYSYQGYLYSKPLSLEAFENLLKSYF